MSEDISLSQPTHRTNHPLAWSLVLFLAGLAWILTLEQSVRMLTLPMYGTMGMAFLPFLGFWTVMMAAMMLPALAPTVSVQMALLRQQAAPPFLQFTCTLIFLTGYLCVWGLFGILVFVCSVCIDLVILSRPLLSIGLGMGIFIGAGLYQFTPQKKRALLRCNPAPGTDAGCEIFRPSTSLRASLGAGLHHGRCCIQCCGLLMLILVAVGLMNLFWMGVMMLAIFLEKAWVHGRSVSIWLGYLLILYGLLAFVSPGLLPGLSLP